MPWDPHSYWCYHASWANACNTPFRGFKQEQYEGGIATPFVVHWPAGLATRPGSVTDQPGHVIDVMATLLDVTSSYPAEHGGVVLKPLRGKSLVPIFHGRRRVGHEKLFFEYLGNRAVRAGQWKLVAAPGHP